MNYVWSGLIIVSIVYSFINGTYAETVSAGLAAAEGSIKTVLSFGGVMCLWSGILALCKAGGISAFIEKILSPILHFLFRRLHDEQARQLMTMNITANLLGMGNAATPAGIAAMKRLDELNSRKKTPSREMCIFALLNTSAISLVPSTAIAMLGGAGCVQPYSIIVPVWIVSVLSLISGLGAYFVICRK